MGKEKNNIHEGIMAALNIAIKVNGHEHRLLFKLKETEESQRTKKRISLAMDDMVLPGRAVQDLFSTFQRRIDKILPENSHNLNGLKKAKARKQVRHSIRRFISDIKDLRSDFITNNSGEKVLSDFLEWEDTSLGCLKFINSFMPNGGLSSKEHNKIQLLGVICRDPLDSCLSAGDFEGLICSTMDRLYKRSSQDERKLFYLIDWSFAKCGRDIYNKLKEKEFRNLSSKLKEMERQNEKLRSMLRQASSCNRAQRDEGPRNEGSSQQNAQAESFAQASNHGTSVRIFSSDNRNPNQNESDEIPRSRCGSSNLI